LYIGAAVGGVWNVWIERPNNVMGEGFVASFRVLVGNPEIIASRDR
jgi:hypothetical protein